MPQYRTCACVPGREGVKGACVSFDVFQSVSRACVVKGIVGLCSQGHVVKGVCVSFLHSQGHVESRARFCFVVKGM